MAPRKTTTAVKPIEPKPVELKTRHFIVLDEDFAQCCCGQKYIDIERAKRDALEHGEENLGDTIYVAEIVAVVKAVPAISEDVDGHFKDD
jgi:hypothetical protein